MIESNDENDDNDDDNYEYWPIPTQLIKINGECNSLINTGLPNTSYYVHFIFCARHAFILDGNYKA